MMRVMKKLKRNLNLKMDKTVVIIIMVSIGILGTVIMWNIQHPCIKSHVGLVHHNAFTSFIYMPHGAMIPIFHPARDSMETICDLRK